MAELLLLFKDPHNTRRPWPHHPSFRRASLRSPSSKTGGAAREIPVLLAPRQDISRSLRTTDRALAKRGLADELENALKLDVKVGKLTLEELLRLYEEKLDKYAPKTIATRQSILKIFKETWPLGLNIPVHSVSTRQLGCQPQGG